MLSRLSASMPFVSCDRLATAFASNPLIFIASPPRASAIALLGSLPSNALRNLERVSGAPPPPPSSGAFLGSPTAVTTVPASPLTAVSNPLKSNLPSFPTAALTIFWNSLSIFADNLLSRTSSGLFAEKFSPRIMRASIPPT